VEVQADNFFKFRQNITFLPFSALESYSAIWA